MCGQLNKGARREDNKQMKRRSSEVRDVIENHLDTNWAAEGTEEHVTRTEMRNERALRVFNRVKDKLTGRDFDPNVPLPVEEQVDRLIKQAQDNIALSQHFTGW
jgi:phosphatidylinositol kinase/protein kinase (PI-3  family)